jgi:FkbM family methyltransferase
MLPVSEVIYDAKLDVWGRRDSHDFKSAAEVRSIVNALCVAEGDVVLDVGGHIGAFTRLCLKRGAYVTSVEPEPTNLDVLFRNASDYSGRFDIIAAAATDSPELLSQNTVPLYLRGKTHTGLHTLFAPKRESGMVDVQTVSFRELLSNMEYTVLKVDIEGGEWLLDFTELPSGIRAVHVEMHMIPESAGGRAKAPVLHQQILDQGFTAVKEPNFKVMWGTHPVYIR